MLLHHRASESSPVPMRFSGTILIAGCHFDSAAHRCQHRQRPHQLDEGRLIFVMGLMRGKLYHHHQCGESWVIIVMSLMECRLYHRHQCSEGYFSFARLMKLPCVMKMMNATPL